MSDWRARKETLYPDHPNYDEFRTYFNRKNNLLNKPLIPYGDPIEVPYRNLYNPRTPPIGIGYCQRCGEVMLVRDEEQKWCRSCRLWVKIDRLEAKRKQRPQQKTAHPDCEADDCHDDE